jgi:hypothetical protein
VPFFPLDCFTAFLRVSQQGNKIKHKKTRKAHSPPPPHKKQIKGGGEPIVASFLDCFTAFLRIFQQGDFKTAITNWGKNNVELLVQNKIERGRGGVNQFFGGGSAAVFSNSSVFQKPCVGPVRENGAH